MVLLRSASLWTASGIWTWIWSCSVLSLICCLDRDHITAREYSVVRPVRTDHEGRVISLPVPTPSVERSRRHAPLGAARQTDRETVYYNVTVFGQELHLKLRPNSRFLSPMATVEWEEESGERHTHPIRGSTCFYSGEVVNQPDTSVAISNCDGLEGLIRTEEEEFFIEPLERGRRGEEERGRQHIVYHSSATINAVNQTFDHYRGSVLRSWANLDSLSQNRVRRNSEGPELFNIEVLLAVDYSVVLFHGRENVQRYVLTIMNIVNEVYQHHSLGANINVVLVRIIMLSATKSHELIAVGNPSLSLEKVCVWASRQRGSGGAEHHDIAVYLTRQEFGPSGMQGYAPVTGMCLSIRSCTLIHEDGFSSAFVIAHEMGHVLGMEHDGEANDCADEVPMGSIMAPLVKAAFNRYHWSDCSRQELHNYLHTYDCLRDDPFTHNWPINPQLPGLHYSMDQQCRYDFGPEFTTCTAYSMDDPCRQLWCGLHDHPLFCKTKKSSPIDGTPCGSGKNCFRGYCMRVTSDLLRQDGGWGSWSSFGRCSRSCGGGIQYRTRLCDTPIPANGGRTCFGNRFEFQLCSLETCHNATDFRAEQCHSWDHIYQHQGSTHTWLPYQHLDLDQRCQLYCQSQETGVVVLLDKQVHDGTRCSYGDPYSVCVKGECEHVGCDQQVASELQEDRCGVCGGDNSACHLVRGHYNRSARKQGYLKILEIPEGARHLMIQETATSPHILAVKSRATGRVFLNEDSRLPEGGMVIEGGVAWEYSSDQGQDTVKTCGPLPYGVLLLVRPQGESKVSLAYKYVLHEDLKEALTNQLHEDTLFYQWALLTWSNCSRTCGGGRQYTRFGCRRRADGAMVTRSFCSNVDKPRAISRPCNGQRCEAARWVTGAWGQCSVTCGHQGQQTRSVECFPASRGRCELPRPDRRRPCNRLACPASWRVGPWAQCSVICGNGSEQRLVVCSTSDGSAGLCRDKRPISYRQCYRPSCNSTDDQRNSIIQWVPRASLEPLPTSSSQRCRGDQSVFCSQVTLKRYCNIAAYRKMCCKSCGETDRWSTPAPPTHSPTSAPIGTTDLQYVEYDISDETSTLGLTSPGPAPSPGPGTGPSTGPAPSPGPGTGPAPSPGPGTNSTAPTTGTTPFTAVARTLTPGSTSTSSTSRHASNKKSSRRQMSPLLRHLFRQRTTTPTVSVASIAMETTVSSMGETSHIPDFLSTTPPPTADPAQRNEVAYQEVDVVNGPRKQQHIFVPHPPRLHEKTQNKRIQELLEHTHTHE